MARDPAKAKAKNGFLSWTKLFGKENVISDPLDIEIVNGKVVRGSSVEEIDFEEEAPETVPEPETQPPIDIAEPVSITEIPVTLPVVSPPEPVESLPEIALVTEEQPIKNIEVLEPEAPPAAPIPSPIAPAPDFHAAVVATSIAMIQSAQQKNNRPSEASDRNMRFRIPAKYGDLKTQFAAKCEANGQDMSKVLVNLMRAYCAMLLLFVCAASGTGTKYSTDDIVQFCITRCGYSWIESIPVNLTASARSAVADAGKASDTSALFYGRHRVEIAVSIPIWSASASRQLKREKADFISAILRDLARLMNEEKLVATMEAQVKALRETNTRIAGRVESGQSGQADLDKSAVELSNAQCKLLELRSRLDEVIFSIAARAGEDWQTARNMVIAWDRKLYD